VTLYRIGVYTMEKNTTKMAMAIAIFAMLCLGGLAVIEDNSANAESYNVYYVVGDVTYTSDTSEGSVTLETIDGLEATMPAGMDFIGWSYNGSIYTVSDNPVTITGNATFTAMFESATYDVTFTYNGITTEAVTYGYGATVTGIPTTVAVDETSADVVAPAGYEFIGWSDGTNTYASADIPTVSADTTYVAVYDLIPATTHTVTFMVDGEQYGAVQTVSSVDDIVNPYIEGYTWGEVVTDAETGNMTVTAVAIPTAEDSLFGLDLTSAVLLIMIFAILVCILIVWLKKEGFIFGGKSE